MKATEQYFSCGAVYYAVQVGSNFWVCGWNPKVWTIQMKATEQYFTVMLFIFQFFSQSISQFASLVLSGRGGWELGFTGVRFFKFSNSTGTLRGFKENSCVFGLLALLFGSELLACCGGSTPPVVEVASTGVVAMISLYLLTTKLTWLLMSWPASRRSRSFNKSRVTRASAKKKKEQT